MTPSKVAETIAAWTEEALGLPFVIYTDVIPGEDADGACIRHDPAPAAEKRLGDGTRLVARNFTLYVRCKGAADAREWCERAVDALDGTRVEGAHGWADCEAVTLPQFIDEDAKGYTTYAASVKCTYMDGQEVDPWET